MGRPKKSIRESLIRKLRHLAVDKPVSERTLLQLFTAEARPAVSTEIGQLLFDGFIATRGTGRKGDPRHIILGSTWPPAKCPLCGHVDNSQ